jgi:hypothetical protein
MFIPQQRIKQMIRRTASTRNWNVYLINSLNTILLGDFDAKVGREDIFKPTIRNVFA